MKLKKAGILTKVVILILLVVLTTTFLSLRSQMEQLENEREAAEQQVEDQKLTNAALSESIAQSSDPDSATDIAREKLGLVEPGEIVFYDGNN